MLHHRQNTTLTSALGNMAEPRRVMAGIRASQHSVSLALLEFVLLGAIYAADGLHHVFPSKVPYLLALAWISLRVHHRAAAPAPLSRPAVTRARAAA